MPFFKWNGWIKKTLDEAVVEHKLQAEISVLAQKYCNLNDSKLISEENPKRHLVPGNEVQSTN